MAEHIWSVISTKTITDKQSNLISLVEIIEELRLEGPEPQIFKPGDKINIPINFTLTTFWTRSDITKPEKFNFRVSFYDPDNKKIGSQVMALDLMDHKRSRGNVVFNSFPHKGPGVYKFKIDSEEIKKGRDTWKNVANIPIEVVVKFTDDKPKTPKRKTTKKKSRKKTGKKKS